MYLRNRQSILHKRILLENFVLLALLTNLPDSMYCSIAVSVVDILFSGNLNRTAYLERIYYRLMVDAWRLAAECAFDNSQMRLDES